VSSHATPYTVIQVTLQHIQHDNSLYSSVKLLYSISNASCHSTAQEVHRHSIHSASTLQQCARSHYSIHSACSDHTTNTILPACDECLWAWYCASSRMTEQWLGGSIRNWITQLWWKEISLQWKYSRHTPREHQQHMIWAGPEPGMLRPWGISAHPCTLSVWCDPYELAH
jgi:hypothetical protein